MLRKSIFVCYFQFNQKNGSFNRNFINIPITIQYGYGHEVPDKNKWTAHNFHKKLIASTSNDFWRSRYLRWMQKNKAGLQLFPLVINYSINKHMLCFLLKKITFTPRIDFPIYRSICPNIFWRKMRNIPYEQDKSYCI